jgi:hypothetical protein
MVRPVTGIRSHEDISFSSEQMGGIEWTTHLPFSTFVPSRHSITLLCVRTPNSVRQKPRELGTSSSSLLAATVVETVLDLGHLDALLWDFESERVIHR